MSLPSRGILAVVLLFLIFRCPAGRDNSQALAALCINDTQNLDPNSAEKYEPLLTISGCIIKPLDGEWITESLGGLFKGDAVLAKIRPGLGVIPPTDYQ